MTWVFYLQAVIIIAAHKFGSVVLESSSACGQMKAVLRCDGDRVAVRGVQYGVRQQWQRPCGYQDKDCLYRVNTDVAVLNDLCSGKQQCVVDKTPLNLTAKSPGCAGTPLYRIVHYDCVPNEQILQVCRDISRTGDTLYVSNQNYPNETNGGNTNCQCLVSSANQGSLAVYAIDLKLSKITPVQNAYCEQRLIFNSSTSSSVFDCSHVQGYFSYREIFSGGPELKVNYVSSSNKDSGKFFLKVTGSSPVTVQCFSGLKAPTSVQSEPSGDDPNGQDPNTDSPPDPQPGLDVVLVGLIAAAVVAVAVAVVVICLLRRKRKRDLRRKSSGQIMDIREGVIDPFILSGGNTPPVNHIPRGNSTFKPRPVLPPVPPVPETVYATPECSTSGYSTPWDSGVRISPPSNQYKNQTPLSHYTYITPDILDHVPLRKEPIESPNPSELTMSRSPVMKSQDLLQNRERPKPAARRKKTIGQNENWGVKMDKVPQTSSEINSNEIIDNEQLVLVDNNLYCSGGF